MRLPSAEVRLCGYADEVVVGFGVLGIYEMRVVGGDEFYVVFTGEADDLGLDGFLALVCVEIRSGWQHVPLQFEIVVIAHEVLPPFDSLVGAFDVAGGEQTRNLAAQTGRRDDKTFVVCGNRSLVGTRMEVEALGPCLRYDFDEIAVAGLVLGEILRDACPCRICRCGRF